MTRGRRRATARNWWWVAGLAIAAIVVVVLAPLASADPDGLERAASDQKFLDRGREAPFSIIPDYTVPGVDGSLSTILAGLIGVVVLFGIMWLIGAGLARRRGGER